MGQRPYPPEMFCLLTLSDSTGVTCTSTPDTGVCFLGINQFGVEFPEQYSVPAFVCLAQSQGP